MYFRSSGYLAFMLIYMFCILFSKCYSYWCGWAAGRRFVNFIVSSKHIFTYAVCSACLCTHARAEACISILFEVLKRFV